MPTPGQHCIRLSGIAVRGRNAVLTLIFAVTLAVATTTSAQAQTFTKLHDFTGGRDGRGPYAPLFRDSAGNLYGSTTAGGTNGCGVGCGTVFKVNASGHESILHRFTDETNDGGLPYTSLIRDKAGNLYGTTETGGTFETGTVFKLSPTGKITLLYSFTAGNDGGIPAGGLIQDAAGNLYGTTELGGTSGLGSVFKVSPTGKETVLHSFAGADGALPYLTSLVMDAKGNLYGVTQQGGASNFGVVYKLSKSGKFTVLHSFAGGTSDGCEIFGTPAMDKSGNLYGTAEACGAFSEGMVWKVSSKGIETVLHNFHDSDLNDGAFPYAGVILGTNGTLYGVTIVGGNPGYGTVYELSTSGGITILHNFAGTDGVNPYGGVIRDANGNLYGTTFNGGSDNVGTVWKLAP